MSTALAEPALPGIAPASASQTPAPPALDRQLAAGEPLKVGLMGHLAEPARVLEPRHPGESIALLLVLHQHVPRHPQAWPCTARWPIEGPRAIELAYAQAHAWPQGTEVFVVGRGLEAGHHQGEPCLAVMRVIHVHEIRHDRAPAEPPAPDLFQQEHAT